jgi:riboflavin kinase / FMN adenylyltransferase
VASIGVRPTVNKLARPLLEVHLFQELGELYGRRLEVRFLAKLREEQKYADLALLREAIAGDVAKAKEYFLHHG